MRSLHQIFSKGGIFMEQKYHRMEGQKPRPVCVAHNYDFAKGGDLQPKVVKFSQNVWIGRRPELTSVTETCRKRGLGAESLAAGDYGDLGAKLLTAGRSYVMLWKKSPFNINAIWITFRSFLEPFERTTFLRFESQLKSSNCLVLPLLTGQAQSTFKI